MLDLFRWGVCYYPEHWQVERVGEDVSRIGDAGFDTIRIAEGAWAYLEPSEGRYRFDVFDTVLDHCRRHGLQVVMGTPTYAGPAWIAHKYPEVLRWNFERIPMQHGSRRNYTYASGRYLELSDRICTAMADRYKRERQVVAWQLDNEFNCHMSVSYSPVDTLAFRGWLKRRYGTLDALNRAWGTAFWSQTYSNWHQVDLPHPTAAPNNPTQLLDESRFISEMVIAFTRRQAAILRSFNPNWTLTHNGVFDNVNGRELSENLDFFSHDQYPLFGSHWTQPASWLQFARSMSNPFAIMEQQAGPGGQMGFLLRSPRPGEVRSMAYQSVAHGAKAVLFFNWRTCPFGSEQHWHGLIDADDKSGRRLDEASRTGRELRQLPDAFFASIPVHFAAVIRDYDNDIVHRRISTYTAELADEPNCWMRRLHASRVPVDYVWSDCSVLDRYRLIVASNLKIVDMSLVERLHEFVRRGGTLVLTAQTGTLDRNAHMLQMTAPGPLATLAGVEVAEWTSVPKGDRVVAGSAGRGIRLGCFVEALRPLPGTDVLMRWKTPDPLLKRLPAITRRRMSGGGTVFYVGGYCDDAAIDGLLKFVLHPCLPHERIKARESVEILHRTNQSQRFTVLINHGWEAETVQGIPGSDLLSTKPKHTSTHRLEPFGVAVVQRADGGRTRPASRRQTSTRDSVM